MKKGMWMKTAVELCPNLQVVPYELEEYTKVSKLVYETVAR